MPNDYYSLLATIWNYGKEVSPRGHLTKELVGVKLVINKYNLFSTPIHRPFEEIWKYLYTEMCWYLSGELNPDKIVRHARMWGEIKNQDGTINSNYGHRVFYRLNKYGLSGFEFALTCLQADKNSRNAIILYNEPDLCFNGSKDFICSQHQHFMIRNNELICLVSLRSSDAIFGLYYNCPWWSLIHQQMFLSLNRLYPDLILGRIEVFIDSAHIYERHFGLVEKILESPQEHHFLRLRRLIPLNKDFSWYQKNLIEYLDAGKALTEMK